MKFAYTFLTTLTISLSASASDLACVTAHGNYDEVEKFQIIDEQYVAMGNKYLDSSCSVNNSVLKCTFTHNRLRPYNVSVNLKTLKGAIKQNFRSEHPILCQKF